MSEILGGNLLDGALGWESYDATGNKTGGGTFSVLPPIAGNTLSTASQTLQSTAKNLTATADNLSVAATGATTTAASGVGDAISAWFVRAVVVVLGFIFVAVGLGMFKGAGR